MSLVWPDTLFYMASVASKTIGNRSALLRVVCEQSRWCSWTGRRGAAASQRSCWVCGPRSCGKAAV